MSCDIIAQAPLKRGERGIPGNVIIDNEENHYYKTELNVKC